MKVIVLGAGVIGGRAPDIDLSGLMLAAAIAAPRGGVDISRKNYLRKSTRPCAK
ncbi:hypothetical protein [Bradyrhizobium valentinum]|uniref:hypothetical protein n=1 Tax=Bradyrhizobium valentinum TaxID=1518501 RepID=UPI0012E36E3A|nr:hypothetical protein [Bradyrhizobium valentinum]